MWLRDRFIRKEACVAVSDGLNRLLPIAILGGVSLAAALARQSAVVWVHQIWPSSVSR
jgi:hypothetical protein